jgi:16S rRNA G527 N7-methylase RsmG
VKQQSELFGIYSGLLTKHAAVKHLVGSGVSIEKLWEESDEALQSLGLENFSGTCVDVGAGQGILGVVALWRFSEATLLLVEPDRRKTAFLVDLKLNLGPSYARRLNILSERIENVSRETLKRFLLPQPHIVLARAFSSNRSLESAVSESAFLSDPLYEFCRSEKEQKFVFRPLK